MRYYELMMVVRPETDEAGLATTLERVNRYINERGGTVIRQQRWGNVRRLAYPIKNYREGSYVLTHMELDPHDTGELEASIRVYEDVLRHLLVRVDRIPEPPAERPQAARVVEEAPSEGVTETTTVDEATPIQDQAAPTAAGEVAPVEEGPALVTGEEAAPIEDEPALPLEEVVLEESATGLLESGHTQGEEPQQ